MVIGNFERALTGWTPSRLLTEWVITVNAIIATLLVLILPSDSQTQWEMAIQPVISFKPLYKRAWMLTFAALVLSSSSFLLTNLWIYQYPPYEKLDLKHAQMRFGREANWRSRPILKTGDSK